MVKSYKSEEQLETVEVRLARIEIMLGALLQDSAAFKSVTAKIIDLVQAKVMGPSSVATDPTGEPRHVSVVDEPRRAVR